MNYQPSSAGPSSAGISSDGISRAELRHQGLDDRQIDSLLRKGRLVPVRRGVHAPDRAGIHEELSAVLTTHRRTLVVSHLSAARLLGLPRPLDGWGVPTFSGESGPTRKRSGLTIKVAPLPVEHVTCVGGLPMTTAARTVVDCARILPGRDALAIADAALHAGLLHRAELRDVWDFETGWPGSVVCGAVIDLANGRRESPLESWSAWAFDQVGLPRPEWQLTLRTPGGGFLGRCDAWWPGVAGEADGRSKYRLAAAQRGGADADTLFAILRAEREREQGFRRVEAEVVRWEPADVLRADRAAVLTQRITRTLTRAGNGRHFTGRVGTS